MIYVLDRDNRWWRAADFYRTDTSIRLDDPERFDKHPSEWCRYRPGGLIFRGTAESVWIPNEFIKRMVIPS